MENIKRKELIQFLKKEIKEPLVYLEPLKVDLDNVIGYLKENPLHQIDDYSLELDSSVENLIVKYSYLDCDGDETTSTDSIRETLKALLNKEKEIGIEFFDEEEETFSVLFPIPLKDFNSQSIKGLISQGIAEIKRFIEDFEMQVEKLKLHNLKEYLTPITDDMIQNSIDINDFIKKIKNGDA